MLVLTIHEDYLLPHHTMSTGRWPSYLDLRQAVMRLIAFAFDHTFRAEGRPSWLSASSRSLCRAEITIEYVHSRQY